LGKNLGNYHKKSGKKSFTWSVFVNPPLLLNQAQSIHELQDAIANYNENSIISCFTLLCLYCTLCVCVCGSMWLLDKETPRLGWLTPTANLKNHKKHSPRTNTLAYSATTFLWHTLIRTLYVPSKHKVNTMTSTTKLFQKSCEQWKSFRTDMSHGTCLLPTLKK